MSQTVDNRVVVMRFDNGQFEKGVDQSIQTLDRLKDSLKLEDSSKGLDNLQKSISKFDTSTVVEGLDKASDGFSAMEIAGIAAIANLTNKVIDFGTQLVKQLAVDPIMEGFSKYEEELKSIQTIMVTTGSTIGFVTEEMRRLAWYTDETSYSYSGMVENIAKFTSQGIGLSTAVSSMQGIANMAGFAGASVQDATHAMEGFSKAMGAGYMSRQNWQWIQTAHMETQQVKEVFIDAAVECEMLKRGLDGVARTAKGTAVTIGNFAETLSEKWLSKKVMDFAYQSMSEYSDFLTVFISRMEELGSEADTCSDYMKILDAAFKNESSVCDEASDVYRAATLAMEDLGITLADGCTAYEYLNYLVNSNSRLGFEQAQMYRTLGDAISATTTAVATGWKEIFSYLFGNAKDASTLWSFVGDTMYDVFLTDLNELKESMMGWYDASGFNHTLEIVKNFVASIGAIVKPIRDALKNLIPTPTTEQLYQFTWSLKKFTEHMIWSEEASSGFGKTLSLISKPLSFVHNILYSLVRGFVWVAVLFKNITVSTFETIEALSQFGSEIKDLVLGMLNFEGIEDTTYAIVDTIKTSFNTVSDAIGNFIEKIKESQAADKIIGAIGQALGLIGQTLGSILSIVLEIVSKLNFDRIIDAFSNVGKAIEEIFTKLKSSERFGKILDAVVTMIERIINGFYDFIVNTDIGEKITKLFEDVLGKVLYYLDKFLTVIEEKGFDEKLEAVFDKLLDIIAIFTDGVLDLLASENFGSALNTALGTINSMFGVVTTGVTDLFKAFSNTKGVENIERTAAAVTTVATSMSGAATGFATLTSTTQDVGKAYATLCSETYTLPDGREITFDNATVPDTVQSTAEVAEKKGGALAALGNVVATMGEKFNVGSVGVLALTGALSAFTVIIARIFSNVGYLVKALSWIPDGFYNLTLVLQKCALAIKNAFVSFMASLGASALISAIGSLAIKMAAAILLISIALSKLVAFDPKQIWSVVGAIAALIVVFEGATLLMVKLIGGIKTAIDPKGLIIELAGLTILFGSMTLLLNGIASCVAKIAGIEGPILDAIIVIGTIWALMMTFIGVAVWCQPFESAIVAFGVTAVLFAAALNLMVTPLLILSLVKGIDLWQGIELIAILSALYMGIGYVASICIGMTGNMLKFAASMVILGVAMNVMVSPILLLALVPQEVLDKGLAVVYALLAIYGIIGMFATKLTGLTANMVLFATSMVILGVAVNGMVASILLAALLPEDKIAQACGIVGGCLAAFVLIGVLCHFVKDEITNFILLATAMVILSSAIGLMVAPIIFLGAIPLPDLLQGAITVGILLALFVGLGALANKIKEIQKDLIIMAGAMAILSSAIIFLTAPIIMLGVMPIDVVMRGEMMVAGMLAIILLLSRLVTYVDGRALAKDIFEFGFAMNSIAISIAILAGVIVLMSYVTKDIPGALVCATAMGILISSLFASLRIMQDSGLNWASVGMFVVLEASLYALVGIFVLLKNIPWRTMLGISISMASVIAVIAFALTALAPLGVAAVTAGGAIAAASVGLLAIATAFYVIAEINTENLYALLDVVTAAADRAGDILILGGALVAFGAGAVIAGSGFVILGAGLLVFGAAMLVLGVAVTLFTKMVAVLAALAPCASQAASAFLIFVQAIATAAPLIGSAIGTIIVEIAKSINESSSHIMQAIKTVVVSIVQAITDCADDIAESVFKVLTKILDTLVKYFPQFVTLIVNGLTTILTAVREKWIPQLLSLVEYILLRVVEIVTKFIPNLVTSGTNMIVAIIEGIGAGMERIINAAWATIITFINGLSEGIDKYGPQLKRAMKDLVKSIIGFIFTRDNSESLVEAGMNAVLGFITGASSVTDGAQYAGEDVGSAFLYGMEEKLDEHSPSKEAELRGLYATLGFVNGVEDGMPFVDSASEDLGTRMLKGLANDDILQKSQNMGGLVAFSYLDGFSNKLQELKEESGGWKSKVADWFYNLTGGGLFGQTTLEVEDIFSDAELDNLFQEANEGTEGLGNGFEDAGDAAEDAGKKTKKTIKTFEELVAEYSFGANEIENFVARHHKVIEQNYDFVSSLDVATYAVSNLAVKLYETNGGILQSTYETQEELEAVLGEIQSAYNDTADAIYSIFASFDPWSQDRIDTSTIADIDKITVSMQNQIEDMDFFSAALDDFLKDDRVSEAMKQNIIAMGTGALQYIRMFNEASDEEVSVLMNEFEYITEMQKQYTTDAMTSWTEGAMSWAGMTETQMLNIAAKVNDALAEGLDVNAGTTTARTMAINVVNALGQALDIDEDCKVVKRIGSAAAQSFSDGITETIGVATATGTELVTVTVQGIVQKNNNLSGDVYKSGEYIGTCVVQGITKGIENDEARSKLMDAVTEMCVNDVIKRSTGLLKVESPSKVFMEIGRYIDEGLGLGIKNNTKTVSEASENLGDATISSFSSMLNDVYKAISGDFDFNPVIRPTLDLSNVEAGASRLGSLLNSNRVALNATLYGTNQNGAKNNGTTYQFTQNNYSPKSLSRVDIYRQTKNQFAMMKEVANS